MTFDRTGRARVVAARAGGRQVRRDVAPAVYAPTGKGALLSVGSASGGSSSIFTMRSRSLMATRLVDDGESPSWAPTGPRFAFVSRRDKNGEDQINGAGPVDAANEIYITDGRRTRRVTRTRANETNPMWSSDGRLILFDLDEGGRSPATDAGPLMVVKPDGSCRTALRYPDDASILTIDGFALRPGSDTTELALRC